MVDRIISHLKLTFVAERPPPPEVAYLELLMAADPAAEYFSQFSLIREGEVRAISVSSGAAGGFRVALPSPEVARESSLTGSQARFILPLDGWMGTSRRERTCGQAQPKMKSLFI